METPATGSSVQQLEKKYQVDFVSMANTPRVPVRLVECTGPIHITVVPIDKHKAVLQEFSYRLIPPCIFSPK